MVTTINVVKESLEKDVKKIRTYEDIAYALSFYSIFSSGTYMFIENDLLTKIMVGTILGSSTIAIYLAIKVMHRKKKLA
jgi:multisubunit Na+/H+ antiporter MnhC subunit